LIDLCGDPRRLVLRSDHPLARARPGEEQPPLR
jgi:hypothetical protein